MQNSETVWSIIDGKAPAFAELSDRVWETPELGFQERHVGSRAFGPVRS